MTVADTYVSGQQFRLLNYNTTSSSGSEREQRTSSGRLGRSVGLRKHIVLQV